MLSPRHALGFANNSDLINYENLAQKVQKPSTAATGSRSKPLETTSFLVAPQNISQINSTGSKDKRLTMLPE